MRSDGSGIEEAERQAAENKRIEGLLSEITRWRNAAEIRAYVDEVGAIVTRAGHAIHPESKMASWMGWALDALDSRPPQASNPRVGR